VQENTDLEVETIETIFKIHLKAYCFFQYVGSIEVSESRGTQVCAEAFRKMKEVKAIVVCEYLQNFTELKRGLPLKPLVIVYPQIQ